jgi:hypothetical protein
MEASYAQTIHNVLSKFAVDPAGGLSDEQVEAQREKHGRNGNLPCPFEAPSAWPSLIVG